MLNLELRKLKNVGHKGEKSIVTSIATIHNCGQSGQSQLSIERGNVLKSVLSKPSLFTLCWLHSQQLCLIHSNNGLTCFGESTMDFISEYVYECVCVYIYDILI